MSMPILATESITKRYQIKGVRGARTSLTALDRISLAVMEGETLGIAGESGCGKSTLAKIMAGCWQRRRERSALKERILPHSALNSALFSAVLCRWCFRTRFRHLIRV